MELNPEIITKINCNISLDKDEVNCSLNCMQNSIRCYQNAPILNNEDRNKHIKECQEIAIKCYLEILANKNK